MIDCPRGRHVTAINNEARHKFPTLSQLSTNMNAQTGPRWPWRTPRYNVVCSSFLVHVHRNPISRFFFQVFRFSSRCTMPRIFRIFFSSPPHTPCIPEVSWVKLQASVTYVVPPPLRTILTPWHGQGGRHRRPCQCLLFPRAARAWLGRSS